MIPTPESRLNTANIVAMKVKNKITCIKLSKLNASVQDDFNLELNNRCNWKLIKNRDESYDKELIDSKLIIKNFFDAVSNKHDTEKASKLQSLTKMVSSVVELEKEGVLDRKEANLLVEFVVGKFVESKFDRIIDNLQLEDDLSWFIASSKQNISK